MKIQISGKKGEGLYVIVDEFFYKTHEGKKYYISGDGYVAFKENGNNYYIHRLVMGAKRDQYVDHINRNKLDNRKSNLRFCTQAQNNMNTKIRKNNISGFRGVYWAADRNKWRARIMINGKTIWLGQSNIKEEASAIYLKKAKEIYGDYVTKVINLPEFQENL